MINISKTRYEKIHNTVNELFIKFNINKYPIDIFSIIKKNNNNNIEVISYSKYMKDFNIPIDKIFLYMGSDDGCSVYYPNKKRYMIFYNDLKVNYKTPQRRFWTIAHELGHVILRHHTKERTKIFRSGLTDEEYNRLEVEANSFAGKFLANPNILNELNIQSPKDIEYICKLSTTASINRYNELVKWQNRHKVFGTDMLVLKQFKGFIQKYKVYCPNCMYSPNKKIEGFCPICGEKFVNYKFFNKGKKKMKYNDGYQLNNKGMAIKCPQCSNEQTPTDGVFCKICGAYLINKCTNEDGIFDEFNQKLLKPSCGMIASGNARYCEYCGEPTTFFMQGFLTNWTNVNSLNEVTKDSFIIPTEDLSSDNLPF